MPGEAVRHAEVASPSACLGGLYGETGLPKSQNPPLGLAGRVRRKGRASTFGTRLTAGVASKNELPYGAPLRIFCRGLLP